LGELSLGGFERLTEAFLLRGNLLRLDGVDLGSAEASRHHVHGTDADPRGDGDSLKHDFLRGGRRHPHAHAGGMEGGVKAEKRSPDLPVMESPGWNGRRTARPLSERGTVEISRARPEAERRSAGITPPRTCAQ